MESCNRNERRVCAKEGKSVSVVKRREGRGTQVHIRTTEERVHQTFKITSNDTSVLCGKEEWEEENGVGL